MPHNVDWLSFCRDHNIPTGNVRKGIWLEVRCPFCGDKRHKGAIHLQSGAYHCWKCGKHPIREFVSACTGSDDMRRLLSPYTNGPATAYRRKDETPDDVHIEIVRRPKGLPLPGSSVLSRAMKQYLRKRGFNATYVCEKYGLHDGGMSGEWAYRLIIPVVVDGKVVSWQGRHIGNNPMRYKAASLKESVNIKNVIYNLDNCRRDRVIVVEGIMDCWRIGDDCCALFGISVKDGQLIRLADRFKEVYFLFDPEPEAQKRAAECAWKVEMLGHDVKAYVLDMCDTDSADPGEMTHDEVVKVKKMVFGDIPDYDYRTPWLRREEV